MLGDCRTEHKLITTYRLGKRDPETAFEFISGLRDRVSGRFQLTPDGWRVYIPIIEDVFGADIDYGWEIKDYGEAEESRSGLVRARALSARSLVETLTKT